MLNKNISNPIQKRNIIEAVTICIYFSDRLKYCLNNRKYLDRWLIVTIPADTKTIELCNFFSIEYCFTDKIFEGGASFAKGKAINEGFSHLSKTGWLLQLDCDIILPNNIRELIHSIPLNENHLTSLFGLRGRRVIGVEPEFQSTRDHGVFQKFHNAFLEKTDFYGPKDMMHIKTFGKLRKKHGFNVLAGSISNQWKNFANNKWNNIVYAFEGGQVYHLGYFQLFHSENFVQYPEKSKNADHDDIRFRERYPKSKRLILDCDCVHLGLIGDGREYLDYLDKYVFSIKKKGEYAFLNKWDAFKKKQSSKLIYRRKLINAKTPKGGLYLISPFGAPKNTQSPGHEWMIWGRSVLFYKTTARKFSNFFLAVYEFNPKTGKKNWFGFSIPAKNIFDRSAFRFLCFNIKTEDLNCGIEVGYGTRKNMEWLVVDKSKYSNKKWCHIRLAFNKNYAISSIDTLIAFRNHNVYSSGKIYLSDIYFQ